MMAGAFLWDSCVIYRWFNGLDADYADHIEKFLEEAAAKQTELFLSTITLAEIRPSNMGHSGLTPVQLLASMSKSFQLIDTSPDIMSFAGYLRDRKYRQVDGPDDRAASRDLSLGDAIHLATAVVLKEEFGVQGLKLHTFDQGRKREGETGKRTVPIDGFQNWCRDLNEDEEVQKVIEIPRTKPVHPQCPLPKTSSK
jgi:hypothetical protein